MKKFSKIFLATAVMSLSIGVFAGMNVSAAIYSGSFVELYGYTNTWSVDTNAKTLTLLGSGTSHFANPNQEIPWLPYADDIETVVVDSRINPSGSLGLTERDVLPNLETIVQVKGDFRASYDIDTKTTTLTGNGKWPNGFSYFMYGMGIPSTLIIGDGITDYNETVGGMCARLVIGKDVQTINMGAIAFAQKIEVKEGNPTFSSYAGCLYSSNHEKLLVSPHYSTSVKLHPDVKIIGENSLPNSLTGTLVLPWGVTTVEKNVFNDFENRMTVVIPDTVTSFDPGWNNSDKIIFMISKDNDSLFSTLLKTGTEIWSTGNIGQYYPGIDTGKPAEPDKDEFAYYDGCKYTKDFQKLLSVPADKKEVQLYPDVKIIGEGSFYSSDPPATIVIPWGVTTIENHAFVFLGGSKPQIILPDTITSMQQKSAGGKDCEVIFTYSRGNTVVHNAIGNVKDSYDNPIANPVDSVDQYYPNRPVDPSQANKKGWIKENGSWYYYKDGHRTSGWILDQGTWYYLDVTGMMKTGWINYNGSGYYLRPWGGMMANGWYQIDGKWYYFQSWGGTAKNSWIYGLDKKWYYVGSNGVMYTNMQTPDGYWVDANGVWVR